MSGGQIDLIAVLRDQLEEDSLELPPLPQVANQVMQMTQDDDVSPDALVELMERDQGLSSHVLRVANSAMLGGKVRIVSLRDALLRLGLDMVSELCVTVALHSKEFAAPAFDGLLVAMWRHAFLSGLFAKEVANTLRQRTDKAFLCGLLHEVGRPLVLRNVDRLLSSSPDPITEIEALAAVDAMAPHYGSKAAEKWELPRTLQAVIECGGDYTAESTFRQQAMVTHAADRMAIHLLDKAAYDEETLRLEPVLRELGLDDEQVDALLAQGNRLLEQTRTALG